MENQLSNSGNYILDDFNSTSNKKLFKLNQIRFSTFLAGPLVGAYMITENFKEMGDRKLITQTWIISIFVLVGMFIISYMFSTINSSPRLLIPILISYLFGFYAKNYQGEYITQHFKSNGNTYGTGRLVLIILIGLAVLVAIALLYSILFVVE